MGGLKGWWRTMQGGGELRGLWRERGLYTVENC